MRWVFDIVNTHDSAPLRAVLSAESRLRLPDATHRGVEEILRFWDGFFAAVPDLTLTMQAMAEQGGTVFVRWTLTGTHSGADLGGGGRDRGADRSRRRRPRDGGRRGDHVATSWSSTSCSSRGRSVSRRPRASRVDVALRRGSGLLARLRP